VDTFILEISLLIGHIRDQFFVDTTPDIVSQSCALQNNSSPISDSARVLVVFTPLQGLVHRKVVAGWWNSNPRLPRTPLSRLLRRDGRAVASVCRSEFRASLGRD